MTTPKIDIGTETGMQSKQISDAIFKAYHAEDTYKGSSQLIPLQSGIHYTGASSSRTTHVKIEAETHFTRFRLHFFTKTSPTNNTVTFSVAPTEEADNSTIDNRYKPIVGGIVDNLQWMQGTFDDGASTSKVLESSGGLNDLRTSASDWIDIASIPTGSESGRPLLLLRAHQVGDNFVSVSDSLWSTASNEDFFRMFTAATYYGADTTLLPDTTPAELNDEQTSPIFIGVEFDYVNKITDIYTMGDSITSGGGAQLYNFDSWGARAVYSKSTIEKPMTYSNGGMSGVSSGGWETAFENQIANGRIPSVLIMPSWSPNNGGGVEGAYTIIVTQMKKWAAWCKGNNVKLIIWTGLPVDGYSESNDYWRRLAIDWAIDNQKYYNYQVVDFEGLVGTGAYPNRFKNGYDDDDGIHPSLLAMKEMAELLKNYL